MDALFLGIVADFQFLIQLFIMVSIASFVLNHLGKGILSILIIGVLFFIVFVMIPILAEVTFIIYLLLMSGVSAIIVDFFFLKMNLGGGQPAPGANAHNPDVTGIDVQHRSHMVEHARHASHAANQVAHNMKRMMR